MPRYVLYDGSIANTPKIWWMNVLLPFFSRFSQRMSKISMGEVTECTGSRGDRVSKWGASTSHWIDRGLLRLCHARGLLRAGDEGRLTGGVRGGKKLCWCWHEYSFIWDHYTVHSHYIQGFLFASRILDKIGWLYYDYDESFSKWIYHNLSIDTFYSNPPVDT